MSATRKIMDGCTAATYIAYALSDVATIYPISPIAVMGQIANKWAMSGVKNLMGQAMEVKELESELGAAGATHGALAAGALASTFTNSQGLLLMIPNMYKISGELLPGVFHVGARSIAAHALSIFEDHQDIMTCRSTGMTMLASASVQETMDLALVAHLAAIEGSLPVIHFFDGWRTGNEMSTIDVIPYESIRPLVNWDRVREIRAKGMRSDKPDTRGTAQNPDVYFQNREAANRFYDAFPGIVQAQMDKVAQITGRQYHLFDYYGSENPDTVIVTMGSSVMVVKDTVEQLNKMGVVNAGVIAVRLFRPFSGEALMKSIPASVKNVAVLDRSKEPGSNGEALYQDVVTSVFASGRALRVVGGRYGLGSKEFDPSMVLAVIRNAQSVNPINGFTVGINDDVTHRSLDFSDHITLPFNGQHQSIFFGIGADGTVGATKMAASIFGNSEGMNAQAFFSFSAKKSGGYTISQLRISPNPVTLEYSIEEADYVGCNKQTYVKSYPLLSSIKDGGTFVLNSNLTLADMELAFPAELKRNIANKHVKFYNVDAVKVAAECGLGVRINTVMMTVFLNLTSILPFDKVVSDFKDRVATMYAHEGGEVVQKNLDAIDKAVEAIQPINYPASWATAVDKPIKQPNWPPFIANIAKKCMSLRGNSLPVSMFTPDGIVPPGTTAYEKRRIAINVPEWNVDNCIKCTECSLVCPHAAIRPVVMDADEANAAPVDFVSKPLSAKGKFADYRFRIQVYPEDCTGCSSCSIICPGHALTMKPLATQLDQVPLLDYAQKNVTPKTDLLPRNTVFGSQMHEPLMQFSGACAGCGETPYVKLITQLFGERMIIANATGCSSIWGANYPSNAYCANCHGEGPAWANSLFEDNAEFGYGIAVALAHRRERLAEVVQRLNTPEGDAWLKVMGNATDSKTTGDALLAAIKAKTTPLTDDEQFVVDNKDLLTKKSVWCVGGDGWAYDIGFAGLDHVLAQNVDINILVLDTECYSNTGGQTSKATPLASVAKYSEDGKRTEKKNLGKMMMSYGSVYVASVALGSDYQTTIKAFVEAEAYPGPSLVIAYCPCIEHGIRVGLGHSIVVENQAVKCGYWPTYRYNPQLAVEGKNPLIVDAPAPDQQMLSFINGEDRYADLKMVDPEEAAILQPELEEHADLEYALLLQQEQMQWPSVPTPADVAAQVPSTSDVTK